MHDKMKLFELCETKAGLISSMYNIFQLRVSEKMDTLVHPKADKNLTQKSFPNSISNVKKLIVNSV